MSDVQTPRFGFRMSATRLVMMCAGVIVAALFAWHWLPGSGSAAAAAAKAPQSVSVDASATIRADVPVYLQGLGTVQAFYTVTITPRVDGELQKIAFVEGQSVKKGDLLAQIDPRPYQSSLDLANAAKLKDAAQLANAQRDLDRYMELAPHDLASKQTVDTQRALIAQLDAQIKGDQATVDNAKTQLDYTHITAPIDGRTGIRSVDPGNNVHASDTTGIVVLTQVQPIAVIFTLPEESLLAVSNALGAGPVEVTAMSRDEKTELDRGTVALIDNQIDQTTGTVRLKATFPNAHNTLWPGEFVNAKVLVSTQKNALTIPSAALLRGANGMFAYVVKSDSTVEARSLTVGVDDGSVSVVDSGLKDGERVVTSNQYRLQPGAHVRINDRASAQDAPAAKDGRAT